MPKFHRIEGAASELSIGRTRLYDAIKRGDLRSIKVGSSRLISDEALVEYAAKLAGELSGGAIRLLELVDENGEIDVERLPEEATLDDLRAVQTILRSRNPQSAA